MSRITILLVVLALVSGAAFAQLTSVATLNSYQLKFQWTGPDSTKPFRNDQGVRSAWVTKDMDKDGKPEIICTDYANGGRVHVFEFKAPNILELVWSSPNMYQSNANSTPRWVRDGDLDGDGNREIIFPVGPRYTGKVVVFEYNGTDNGYGATPGVADLELPATQFAGVLGASSALRMDRETGTVEDLDGDGKDELIMANQDNKVYILGVVGDIGGFGSWDIEGGNPTVNPENKFSGGSWWHSIFADVDGDGQNEIVNHYWNHYGFWSIEPKGADKYRYPTPGLDSATVPAAKNAFYHEYSTDDAVAYMGVQPVDVDGDGKKEIAGILYVGGSPDDYQVSLTALTKSDTGLYVWRDSSQFGIIGRDRWTLAGKSAGSFWGIGAYDFNKNGREEILLGGSADYNVVAMEYKGTGSLTDPANYTSTIYYPGEPAFFHNIDYYDSLGITSDTVKAESPFVSKMFAGCDVNGNGKPEIMLAYQSVADSVTYRHYSWDTSATPDVWRLDSTWKKVNVIATNVRMVEWDGTSFVPIELTTITPDDYVLDANYPNPFNPTTNIRFSLPAENKISLVVYDMLGREVKTLIAGQQMAKGAYLETWDGTNNAGAQVASGSYVYTLKFGNFSKSQKMMLVR